MCNTRQSLTIVHEVFVDKHNGIGYLAPKCVCGRVRLKWTWETDHDYLNRIKICSVLGELRVRFILKEVAGIMLQTPVVIPIKPEYSS